MWRKQCAATLAVMAVGLAVTCGVTSARWMHATFPGVFVMANRVIASVSLPHWPVAHRDRRIYQHAVTAVEDQPVATTAELYALVRRLPPGTPITYVLEKNGETSRITLPSLVFSLQDYLLIFGAYLLNGLALALIGLGVWFLKPAAPAGRALCISGVVSGLFTLTAVDLYGPHWFFRLHVLSEALFPAGFIHLALVFPIDRFRRYRSLVITIPYVLALLLGTAYEVFLYNPAAYSLIHNLCMVYVGIGAVIFIGKVAWDYWETDSYLVRQKIRVLLLGFLAGFALPAGLMFASGMTEGDVAVNYAAFTAFLFPLSVGYAIVKHDLFEIDVFLKRGAYYVSLTVLLTLFYLAFLAGLSVTLRSSAIARSPFFPLLFTLAVALFLNPLKDHLQQGVDRIFFRTRYNPKKMLESTSAYLASTLHLEEILTFLGRTISETLGVQRAYIFLCEPGTREYALAYPREAQCLSLSAAHPFLEGVQQHGGRDFSVYDLTNDAFATKMRGDAHRAFVSLNAQLIVPLLLKRDVMGLIVLGKKESGSFFSADDRDFLHTLANQSALSIANARAYQEIQTLNAGLEEKVGERTRELAYTNEELQSSLRQLEQAYRELQRSQEHLQRAEKMAALGRLTAGIAHEMNTPLGASLTSLKLLSDLVEEYLASIEDSSVEAGDHQEIATDMQKLVRATQQWVEKATAHIRSLKAHTRDWRRGEEQMFSVLRVVEDTGMLLAHRLRLSQCSLLVSCTTAQPLLHGDPGKLGQVLTNLIINAIDAYKGTDGGEVRVDVLESAASLEIRVRDHGCGIPSENMGRIFEEFFSTKALGEGTGLGLSIARDIVTTFFGGTIAVESAPGQGSEFILRLPQENKGEQTGLSVVAVSPAPAAVQPK
jgi:signal transduction histidine kinase